MGMLDGKVVIVTGAGQGIGESACLLFAREGAKVVVAEISPETGKRTADKVVAAGGQAVFVQTDVSKEDQIARMVDTAVKTYGRLDCAFNNAGFGNEMKLTAELDPSDWDRVQNVVLRGVFLSMKYEIPAMLKSGGGSIVNTSSNSGVRATLTQAAYCAAKAGVIGLSRTTAAEYGEQNIRVNVICPGLTRTPAIIAFEERGVDWSKANKIALGRAAEPIEIAESALWLLSSRSSYVTGQHISIDGGSTVY